MSKSLAKKLVEKRVTKLQHGFLGRVEAGVSQPIEDTVKDIEDAVTGERATKSTYFSPLQTRRQRKANKNEPSEVGLIKKPKKLLKETLIKEVEKPNIIQKSPKAEIDVNAVKSNWEPKQWQLVLQNIRQMRSSKTAPVDTMGCHKCADDDADEKTQRYQKLVALMLSSQTKDETTFQAMQRLKDNTLTPESIVMMKTTLLESLLYPVSFYKNKAKYLQQTSRILTDKYSSDIPNNIKELVALPGVGPKMAHICMATAWNEVTGIGVDVHVHRITNRLRWIPKETKEPEQTRVALEAWLPQELWREVNYLLVGFGQTVCVPVRPHCGDCLNADICPAANKATNTTIKSQKNKIHL